MKKIAVIILAVSVILSVFAAVFGGRLKREENSMNDSEESRVKIVTTLFPLYDFARQVGGGEADISLLLPPGSEAHSYEPSPQAIASIQSADVFIYTGKEMEPWVAEVLEAIAGSNLIVVDSSSGVNLIKLDSDEDEESGHEGDDTGHSFDPHIWLDFANAAVIVENIASGLEAADPGRGHTYKKNAENYKNKLFELDANFKESLSDCERKDLVHGGHYAFGYLARRYGLNYVAAQGFSADSEASPKTLVSLVEMVRQKGVRYIFYEELIDPKIARTIANETGAELLLLNAAHNIAKDDFEGGATFLLIMEKNLINLRKGLGCR